MDQLTPTNLVRAEELKELIVDDPAQARFDVNRRIYRDPEIFELEMRRIFESNWVYLAHESQLPKPHDYYATWAGRQPVLLTRDKNGALHGFINTCSHRGAKLTFTKRGNKQSFMCPYHGWVYDTAGQCIDVNEHASGGYPAYFDKQDHNLRRLGRLDSYRGFIFGSINPEVEPLIDWLDQSKVFIDLFVEQSPDGLELLKGEVNYTNDSNWKMQIENPDAYHFFPVHLGYIRLQQERARQADPDFKVIDVSQMGNMPGGCYDLGHGHTIGWTQMPNGDDRPLALARAEIEARCGKNKARWMVDCVRAQLIYPNLWLMDQSSTTLRVVHPIGVDKTRIEVYCIAPVGESSAARTLRVRQFEDFLGPAGLATPDDQAVLEQCQKGFAGRAVDWQQGYARGNARIRSGGDEAAGGIGLNPYASGRIDDELIAHPPLRRWRELMTAG